MPKTVKKEDIVVGKDILELLGSAMYADPMNVYREYIQNAVDSIDEAERSDLYSEIFKPKVDIDLNLVDRKVTITDNGKGIPNTWFKRVLLSFGASKKRGTDARGFRGVGRLAGLGYCKNLIFETRYEGQDNISKMVWNCVELKRLLLDAASKLNLAETVEAVTEISTRTATDDDLPHFFKVTMESVIRHGNDLMLNEDTIENYLSQVAPVPFAEEFKFGSLIENKLNEYDCYCAYHIYIKNKSNYITRPYRNHHAFKEGMITTFNKINFYDISGVNGISAAGWILHSDYLGAFANKSGVGGLRIRSGNIQIGDESVLSACFPEARFNNWSVGEVHLISTRLVPNGRRDNLEHNTHYDYLKAAIINQCNDITNEIRNTSSQRNILKVAAKLRNGVEAHLEEAENKPSQKNSGLHGLIIEDLKPLLEYENCKLDKYSSFKEKTNIHHNAYNREMESIANCISRIDVLPKSNTKSNIERSREIQIGSVLDVLSKIGADANLIRKFISEIEQLKFDKV